MKKTLLIAGIALGFAACNPQYEKTSSGLAYKIYKGDGKQKLKHGQVIKINGIVKVSGKDTVLYTTYGRLPEYLPVDTTIKNSHSFDEILKYASVGDSIVAVAQADTLVKTGRAQYTDWLKQHDEIITSIKILAAFDNQQAQAADQQKEVTKLQQGEVAAVQKHLNKKGIKAVKTANGVFVEVKNPGQGPKIAAGQQVTVNYKGYLMEDGKVFDSNIDTAHGHVQPFSFVVGSGQTIPAWDEGFQYFGKGGKGTLYVPSLMGYGPGGRPPVIPPLANLVFEVEVTDVGAPDPSTQQQPPQQ